jgi:hypothetical protein
MQMKRALLVVIVIGLLAVWSPGAFGANDWYLAQDDFLLTYAAPNNPGAPGSTFSADGRLMPWATNTISNWFAISGASALGAQSVGTQWVTDYAGSTLNIYADNLGNPGALVWTGTADHLYTIVNKSGAEFAVTDPPYDRPSYSTDPSKFNSVGSGLFTRTAGTWTCPQVSLPWLGTYNWNYVYDGQGNQIKQKGNIQAKLTCVPEPMSVMLGALGLAAVGGFRRFRK